MGLLTALYVGEKIDAGQAGRMPGKLEFVGVVSICEKYLLCLLENTCRRLCVPYVPVFVEMEW